MRELIVSKSVCLGGRGRWWRSDEEAVDYTSGGEQSITIIITINEEQLDYANA